MFILLAAHIHLHYNVEKYSFYAKLACSPVLVTQYSSTQKAHVNLYHTAIEFMIHLDNYIYSYLEERRSHQY